MKRFKQTAVVFALTCVVYLMTGAAADAQTKPSVQPGPAAETGTVIGTVFDSQSGNGVRGASVEAAETRQVAATDIDGKYILKLAAGKYTRYNIVSPDISQGLSGQSQARISQSPEFAKLGEAGKH